MFALTPRLLLRPGWPEDAPDLARAIGHEVVITRLARVPWPYTEAHARDFLHQSRAGVDPVFQIVERDASPRLIGGIGIHDDEGSPEVGYWLTPDAWGRGFATEAGRAVLAIAHYGLRLPRLRARYMVDNPASGRVLAKLGFRATGRIVPLRSVALGREVDAIETELDLSDVRTEPVSLAA